MEILTCSSQTFQKVFSERFAEVQRHIDSKISEETKENRISVGSNCTKGEGSGLDDVKTATKNQILNILNSGNMKSLMSLKTIGKKRAEAIFKCREETGPYGSLEELSRAGLKDSQISALFKANLEL